MKSLVLISILYSASVLSLQSLFTQELCKEYDHDKIYTILNNYEYQANDILKKNKKFNSVTNGWWKSELVGSSHAALNGGGTNPFGFYGALLTNTSNNPQNDACRFSCFDDTCPGGKCANDSTISSFVLGPSDVVAMLMCTPPKVRYYSYDITITGRKDETINNEFYPGQPFGDAINNLNIPIEGNDNGQGTNDAIFDAPILLLVGPDEDTMNEVYKTYLDIGVVNEHQIIKKYVDYKTAWFVDRSATKNDNENINENENNKGNFIGDIFGILSRVTFGDPSLLSNEEVTALAKYSELLYPAQLYMTDSTSNQPKKPVSPPIQSRTIGKDGKELDSEYDDLKEPLKILNDVISYKWTNAGGIFSGFQTANYSTEGFYDDWQHILDLNKTISFAMETRDATYGFGCCFSGPTGYFYLPSASVIVFGVLHAEYYDALYHSLGVDIVQAETTSTSMNDSHWFMDDFLKGSATRYIRNAEGPRINDDMKNTISKYFFALDFLPDGQCSGHPNPKYCFEFNTTTKAWFNKAFFLGERVYGVKSSTVGPPAEKMIPPRLITFDSINLKTDEL